MFAIHSETFAQAMDVEPNNECNASQSIGDITPPFVLNGSLDTPPELPDVDFFQFSSVPGLDLVAELKGQTTGVGTLPDPFLGLFDSDCNVLFISDNSFFSLDSRINFSVPNDGVFILAASSCCDFELQGVGGSAGTYELTISLPPPSISSISARVVDAQSGDPLSGETSPFAFAQLARCDDFGCFEIVSDVAADSEGRVVFENDFFGTPLPVGTYQITAFANEFESATIDLFAVAEGEDFDVGDIVLTPSPISFSGIEICDALLPQGGACRYSVAINNNTRARLRGLAWSPVDGFGLGSTLDFTTFEASASRGSTNVRRERVCVEPLSRDILEFQFDVPSFVRDGAGFCTRVFFGLEPSPLINTVRKSFLFCIEKGATGFRVMSAPESQKIFETLSGNIPSLLKFPSRGQRQKN